MEKVAKDNVDFQGSVNDEVSEKEYKRLKAKLQSMREKKTGKSIYVLTFILFVLTFLVLLYDWYNELNVTGVIISVFAGVVTSYAVNTYANLLFEMKENIIRRRMIEYEVDHIQENVEVDVFENSIKMSYKYLDQYYLQTREHSQRGFFITVCVAIFGALLIGVGIVAMFLGQLEPSYVTSAAGVITEFIAAIFFYLYNRTVSSMSKYHNKLVLSQNISIALKIADSLPEEDKAKTKNLIVTELLKDINCHLIKDDTNVSS